MNATLSRLEKDVAMLRAQLAPPAAPLSARDVAERSGIVPDAWQADVLTSTSPRLLLNACRQSGKSTIVATVAVHTALAEPGALVLLVSPTLRQSGELFRKALAIYRALERPVPSESETALTLTLTNGSRLVSLPGKEGTVRGYSGVTLLAIDEASRVPDDLYVALRPMLAVSGGRLIALSTPWGRRGWFHREWSEGEGWETYEIPATTCPRIPAAFLEEERLALGPLFFRSEYCCEFVETEDQLFAYADIEAAFTDRVTPLWPGGFHAHAS
jgi:hypothetical protein